MRALLIIIAGIGLLWGRYVYDPLDILQGSITAVVSVVVALILSSAIRIADPWDKVVVLRWDTFVHLKVSDYFSLYQSLIDTILD